MPVLTFIDHVGYLKIAFFKIKILLIINLNNTDIGTILIVNHIDSLAF